MRLNTHSKTLRSLTTGLLVFASIGLLLAGCSKSRRVVAASGSTTAAVTTTFVQVERLGRPAVNEGLVQTNAFLNAFNGIAPNQDLSVLTDPANSAFLNEVLAVLNALDGLAGGADNVNSNDVVRAFLPDTMRIDTSLSVPLGTAAYSFSAVPVGTVVRPVAGRKLEDDVVDITASVLAGGTVSDNVDYRDGVADGVGQPDHALLNGQTTPGGAATFPFLAPAQ